MQGGPTERQRLDRFLRWNRIDSWALGTVLAALAVAALAAWALQAGAPGVALAVLVVALVVAAGAVVIWVVAEVGSNRAIDRIGRPDVMKLIDARRWDEAIANLEPQLSSSDPDEVIEATNLLADVYAYTSRNAEAEKLIRRAIDLAGDDNDTLGEQLACLGAVLRRQERVKEAEDVYTRALDVLRKRKDAEGTVFALRNVAYLYWSIGRDDRARQIYEQMPEFDADQMKFVTDILKPYQEPALPAGSR